MKISKLRHRSLHPFQIIFDGEKVYVHRGMLVDVPIARAFDVTGAIKDLRYEEPEDSFETEKNLIIRVEMPDPSTVNAGDAIRITGAHIEAVAIGGEDGQPIIGRVQDGKIHQELKSDFYYFAVGSGA